MGDLQTIKTDIAPTLQQQQNLLYEFIAYIDRGEQTTRTYINNLKAFFAWQLYTGRTSPLTRQDIIAYKDYLTQEHDAIKLDPASPEGWTYRTDHSGEPVKVTCKPSTTKQYLQIVRQLFKWASVNGYYETDIGANIHPPKVERDAHKKRALTAADVLIIERSIEANAAERAAAATDKDRATEQGKRLFAMYQLAVTAGLRTCEISRANVKDIETINGKACIYIYGKGRSEADQKKPIPPAVYEAIQDYLKSRADRPTDSSPLFVATGNRSGGKRLATTTISTMLKRAMQQAGYDSEKLTAHSLRHTTGNSVMELTGDNLYLTQQYMRHKNPRTTEIYLHRNIEKQEAEIARQLYEYYHRDDGTAEPGQGEAK